MSHTGQGTAPGQVYTWNGTTQVWAFPSLCTVTDPSAAELQAAINAATATATDGNPGVVLVCGHVTLEDRILIRPAQSNLFVEFSKNTEITTTMAPAVGLADDPDNNLFDIRGVVNPVKLNTTLTAIGVPGDMTITVASLGTIAVGDYVSIGANCSTMGTDINGGSAGNTDIYDTHKVVAIDVPTKTLTLDEPLYNYFGASGVQPARVLAVDPVRNITFENGFLNCSGGSIADGFYTEFLLNARFSGQQAVGFSRSTIEPTRTQNWLIEDFVRRGETNADIFTRAAHNGIIRGYRYEAGARQHANGYPRGNITMRQRSNGDRIEDSIIGGGNVAILTWGGFDLAIDGVTARDCNPAARIARANFDGGTAGTVGSVLQTNCADLALSDYPFGMEINGLHVETVGTPGNPGTAVYLEDVRDGTFDDISIVNLGVSGAMNGLLISDCKSAAFGKVSAKGCERALVFENGGYSCTFDAVEIDGIGGSGAQSATAPIYLNLGIACTLLINRLRCSGINRLVEFGNSYPATNIFEVYNYVGDGVAGSIDSAYAVANGSTGNKPMGSVVQLDPTTANRVVDPGLGGAPSRCLTVLKGTSDDTSTMDFIMVAITKPGNASQVRVASAEVVAPGDSLRHGASGEDVVDAAATSDSHGVAVGIKAAGAALLMATR